MVLTGTEFIFFVDIHVIPIFGFFNENGYDSTPTFQLLQSYACTEP